MYYSRNSSFLSKKNSIGATAVEYEDGMIKMIDGTNPTQREALAKTLFTEHRASGGGKAAGNVRGKSHFSNFGHS